MVESKNDISCFDVVNNVYIDVLDEDRGKIIKTVEIHNKATRRMVTGILRFLCGHFNATNLNSIPQYSTAKNYIPCYFNFGYGGTTENDEKLEDGATQTIVSGTDVDDHIPQLYNNWDQKVDYNSTSLVQEVISGRQQIRIGTNTFCDNNNYFDKLIPTIPNKGDMDGVFFFCQASPNSITGVYENTPIYITELGLFANNDMEEDDLLAYVKLGNYYDPDVDPEQATVHDLKTNVLYVRPQDTVVIRWVITIAAIGKDSTLQVYLEDETGESIEDSIVVPTIGNVEIIVDTDD